MTASTQHLNYTTFISICYLLYASYSLALEFVFVQIQSQTPVLLHRNTALISGIMLWHLCTWTEEYIAIFFI